MERKPLKRRKTQSSTSATASKPRKVPAPKKARKSKTAGDYQRQDISKGLPRKKSTAPGLDAEPVKTVSPADLTLLEQRPDAELIHDALVAFEAQHEEGIFMAQDQYRGLNNKSRAAYLKPHFEKPGGQVAAPADHMLAKEYLTINDEDVACNDAASPKKKAVSDSERFNRVDPWDEDSEANPSEFMPPPSAQGADIIGSTNVSSLQHKGVAGALPENCPGTDDNCYNGEDADEFPLEEADVDAMMQSEVSFAALEENGDGCCPQGLYDYDSEEGTRNICITRFSDPVLESGIVTPQNQVSNPQLGHLIYSSPRLQSSQQPCILTHVSGNVGKAKHENVKPAEGSENCFDDDDLDEDLKYLPAEGSDIVQSSTPLTSPEKPSTPKLQWLPPKVYIPAKSSQVPVSPTDIPHLVPFNINGEPLPFTRSPFPKPIRDRSPILGLTDRTVLRTCFRIGEALNAAAVASRTNADAVIELYARIVHSERETDKGFKQFLQFGDLFTEKPPYLSATYSLWKGAGLWDKDSKAFLGEDGRGKMARALGRIKKREKGGGCEMVVLSIWEVDWEDVGIAKGIVCS